MAVPPKERKGAKDAKGAKGIVKSYDMKEGRGEIEADSGEVLPVRRRALLDESLSGLFAGDIVEFKAGRDRFGRRAALEVRRIGWDEAEDEDAPPREWTF